MTLDWPRAECTREEYVITEPAGRRHRPATVPRAEQSRQHELRDREREEDDNEADRAVREPLLRIHDLVIAPACGHPEEATVERDAHRDDAEEAECGADDLRNRDTNVL